MKAPPPRVPAGHPSGNGGQFSRPNAAGHFVHGLFRFDRQKNPVYPFVPKSSLLGGPWK